ncbi:XRE family transcriptional regulator [Deinococcus cellulosilyticus]|uniref:HTH cro/C1-type domain-containing protein n=1 Tax=Deinococcus cellulosilyticus (strain DSM 18568 / NBRC 106333 / KACC 11606 / 5516J-15) TaxID=1223518 RepID=A0A511N7Q4_DEIC1|nr:XRE family transcriptional regulator [Deinococcus cellulosilyticus]GEM48496.1 hypothetical protein DC3_41310 [Deinococcus cellulosilyticus NBRC 106333 = KACC 11606]
MNEEIRKAIQEVLYQKRISQADLARRLDKTPQEISRALKDPIRGGKVPELWQDILDELDLELVIRPRAKRQAS